MLFLLLAVSVLLEEGETKRYYWTDRSFDYRSADSIKFIRVFFQFDSAELLPSERKKLEGLKGKRARIEGYASPEGSLNYNSALSHRRAKAVQKVLEKHGIKEFEIRAFGETGCREKKENWWRCRRVDVWLEE